MAKPSSSPRFRILPLTIGCMGVLLFSKTYDLYTGTSLLLAGEAFAKTDEAEGEKTEDMMAAKPAEAPGEGPAADAAKAAATAPVAAEGAATGDTATESGEPAKDASSGEAPTQFSQVEVDLLQSLSARRKELDKWEEEIRMKESLLEATEVRLDRKIEEIQAMEAGLKKLLDEYNQHEDTEIRSLVKIYENMKPKDAAQIFDEMEMPILLLVVDKMSERKAAPILAQMTPLKAKELTVELAESRKMRSQQRQQSLSAAQ